jgi:oligopeptide/dipeptide ABC transporter ATP-binding protein
MDADRDLLLEVRDLRVVFPLEEKEVAAVDGASFAIPRGKTLGLVGESGCGKSVTGLSLLRLVTAPGRIAGGEILYYRDGPRAKPIDIAQLPPDGDRMRAIRGGEIAMIFQEPMTSLNPVYTIGQQIAEAVVLHQRVGPREARERAVEMLAKVGIPAPRQRVDEYPHQLSGGMRQRAMIAMALSCRPSLLIADEPTTALDVTIQAQILDLMRELQEELGTAILMISHDLGVIADLADEVVVMYAGRLVERAPVEALFDAPLHPYTRGLMRSIPVLGSRSAATPSTDHPAPRLAVIGGAVPSLGALPRGCAFRPRCAERMERCREAPDLVSADVAREVRCWLHSEGCCGPPPVRGAQQP